MNSIAHIHTQADCKQNSKNDKNKKDIAYA